MRKNCGGSRFPAIFSLFVLLSVSGCEAGLPDSSLQVSSPIIRGNEEAGWPAVGALVLSYPFYGFTGSFCSGTLIAPRWVLTAAHCVTPSDEFPIAPGIVSFMFTSDARPTADGTRPEGTLVQADYFIPHASYNGRDNDYDIALVHLSRDVTEVTPLPFNSSTLSTSLEGKSFFFVGFGVNNGATETGGGVKRSAYIPIADINQRNFLTDAYNTAVCFGDSGGPALYQVGGEWRVVGVNSAVSGYGSDPCIGIGIHVRVDSHTGWIEQIMGSYPPNCRTNPSACLCSAACDTVTGDCDESACETMFCDEVVDCVFDCYGASNVGACGEACYISGDDVARAAFDNAMGCYGVRCYPSRVAWETCMANACNEFYNACYLSNREPLDCAGVSSCWTDCLDGLCRNGCEWLAIESERPAWQSLKTCIESNCADLYGAALSTCLSTKCPSQTTACMKPDECDPRGGDCPDGEKCRQFMEHTTTCVESQGLGVGEKCRVEVSKADPCADGLVCMSGEGGRLCRHVCSKEEGCQGEGEVCKGQPFPSLPEWGWCGCVDLDEDTVCADKDCDDTNSSIFPGAREWCDGVDNNCDEVVDEGCTQACDDADDDGSCDEADCDDERDTVHPGAVEVCGDGLDNDCNGTTDDGCDSCVDLDKDGYCADRDCNDRDYRISPKAEEVCGDGIDNDCDSSTDEDCGSDDVIGEDSAAGGDEGGPVAEGAGGCSAGPGSPFGLLLLVLPLAFVLFRRRVF